MSWMKESIMMTKGVAKGNQGESHNITIESQGKFHYVYGPYAEPVLTVDPGALISVETHDAFEGGYHTRTQAALFAPQPTVSTPRRVACRLP